MIENYIVNMARQMGSTGILLLADDIQQLEDASDRRQAMNDLIMLIGQSAHDRIFRNVFLDWVEEGSTVTLRDLFDFDGLDDGQGYWDNPDLAHRIDILDSAALHIRDRLTEFNDMEDLCKLAIENGASFTEIAEGGVERAFSFVERQEPYLNMADLRRYDVAMTAPVVEHLEEPS
jgi:hypothetical protein